MKADDPSITLRVDIRCSGLTDAGCRAAQLCFDEVFRMVKRSALIRALEHKGYEWSIENWSTEAERKGGAA